MQVVRYPYGEDFQFKILALMVQDPVFLPTNYDSLNPQFFERVHLNTACHLILNYYIAYKVIPQEHNLYAYAEDHIARSNMAFEVANSIRQTLQWIYHNPIADPDFVKSRVLRFGQRQALKGAVNDIIDRLERDDDYEECRDIVERALQVGMEKNYGLDLGSDLVHLPRLIHESNTYAARVPTALPQLDACMQGGLGRGELGVIVAPSGTGKTTLLTNIGFGALMYKYKVLHITLELKEIDIALKYAARHTQMNIGDIVKNDQNFFAMVNHYPIPPNQLKIKYFSPGTATTSNIRALLSFLRGQGFSPDIVLVDYIKKMKHDGEATGALGRIADDFIAMGDDFGVGVWTAQQAQRNYRFTERTNVSGIANDISIIENCDVALAISQREEEHQNDMFRLETGKVRRGDDANVIPCWCSYHTCTVQEMDDAHRSYYYPDPNAGRI